MNEPLDPQISAVAALDEPTRRRLYDHVARQTEPVSRDEAAAALRLPRATAVFHLDRLVDEGLLDVVYQRLTGRTGPGAGRPSKLYSRSQREVTVSLPERRYDLAGRLLAAAVEEADRCGESPRTVLDRRAYETGKELGETTRVAHGRGCDLDAVLHVLDAHGYEPRFDGVRVLLDNCPFHTLAREHTQLVCAMNLRLLDGLLDGLGRTDLRARLDPTPAHCCVRLEPTGERHCLSAGRYPRPGRGP